MAKFSYLHPEFAKYVDSLGSFTDDINEKDKYLLVRIESEVDDDGFWIVIDGLIYVDDGEDYEDYLGIAGQRFTGSGWYWSAYDGREVIEGNFDDVDLSSEKAIQLRHAHDFDHKAF